MRMLPLLAILAACGRIGFDAQSADDAQGVVDAQVIDSATFDAPADARTMVADGPFEEPLLVVEISNGSFDDDDPSLTGDMLEIYFKSDRGTGADIFGATRASVDGVWSAPERIDELSTLGSAEDTPEVSYDGLTMHLSSDRDGGFDLYRSTRASRSDPWSIPVRIDELVAPQSDFSATMDGAGLHLVLNRDVAGNQQLFAAERSANDLPWSSPAPIDELNTDRYEADAVLDESGLRLFYTTVEADPGQQRQLYLAERDTVESPFGPGEPITELNTDQHDEDPWISPDLSVIFFSRTDPSGRKDIFTAARPL